MDRTACVDLPAFPLQLLLRREPTWRGQPVAVVDRDHPQGRLLWVNEEARRLRVLPGLRYAAALALTSQLRAGVVAEEEIARGLDELMARLSRFSPEIEPSRDDPGVFWLNASGLSRLFPSASAWAAALHAMLEGLGYASSVVVGYTRFGTYAAARAGRGPRAFADPAAEQDFARHVPLERLDVEPKVRDRLARLGVRTVGALMELPAEGLFERFGPEAHRLARLASGRLFAPLSPLAAPEALGERVELEYPEGDRERLLALIRRALEPLVDRLASRGEALGTLHLAFALARGGARREALRPAHPTLERGRVLELVRLRLEASPLDDAVEELALEVEGARLPPEQLALFATTRGRDLRAGERALARVRAELGEGSVARARLSEGHLPEAGFVWEPIEALDDPRPGEGERALVRRLFERPLVLPPRRSHLRDDGWLIRDSEQGAVTGTVGPFLVSGGWWVREVEREYHFAHTKRGDLLWVFYDRRRRRWCQQGRVE